MTTDRPTIRTTYFGGLGSEIEPGPNDRVFGVVRKPLEFIEEHVDRNIPALAPPQDLLDAFKRVENAAARDGHPVPSRLAWETVDAERRYLSHLKLPGPGQVLAEVAGRLTGSGDIILVCYERDVRYCHRRLLADAVASRLDEARIVHHPDPQTCQQEEYADRYDKPADPSQQQLADPPLSTRGDNPHV